MAKDEGEAIKVEKATPVPESAGSEEDTPKTAIAKDAEPPGKDKRKRPTRPLRRRTKDKARRPRTVPAIKDLPPDRQAEIASSRAHQSARRKHVNRPQLPAVSEDIELHSTEINLLYIRHFEPCNQYAIAIDTVARERLTNRVEFNRYLQDFDAAIEQLAEKIRALYAEYEELSAGSMTTNKMASTFEADLHTRRSLQILRLFKNADDVIRMVQYLNIYNDLDDQTASRVLDRIANAINRCVRALRKVKLECFRRIVESESLAIPVSDDTTIEDLTAARRIAKIGQKNQAKKKTKVTRSRKKKTEPLIDPSASASVPVGTEPAEEAPDAAGTEKPDHEDEDPEHG